MKRTVDRARAAIAADVPYSTLTMGKFQGKNTPPKGRNASGREGEKWSVSHCLAVRVCRVLEQRGIPLSAMVELFNTLWTCEESDLRRLFREGRRFVMVVGKQPCGKALFTEEEISANPMIDYRAAKEAGLPLPQGLDIENEYNRVVAAMMLEGLE